MIINLFKQWQANRRRTKILSGCRAVGHQLNKIGEGREQEIKAGVPIPCPGPAALWVMGCKCGYSEICDCGTKPYVRSFADGEKLIKEQSKNVKKD